MSIFDAHNPRAAGAFPLAAAAVLSAALADAAQAETAPSGAAVPVPSGMEVRWLETLRDSQGADGLTLRFRFVAPALAKKGRVSEDAMTRDMQALCETYALPRIAKTGPKPAQVVISVASKPAPFGQVDANTPQYFEAYSIDGGQCAPELF